MSRSVKILQSVEREVSEVDTDEESYIEIGVTRKEAVDVDGALTSLFGAAINGDYEGAESVGTAVRLWNGRARDSPTVMLTGPSDTQAVLDALDRYEPDEIDLTDRLHHDFREIINESELDF